MFKFDMSNLDDRDINDVIEALYKCACVEGQRDNIGLQYLLGVMCEEGERRNGGDIGGEVEIDIPIGEMTAAHLLYLTRFLCAVLQAAAKGEPSEMARFFAGVVNEIEAAAMKMAASVAN